MKALFSELKRRKVFRVAGGYAVLAWLVAQIADVAVDSFGAPGWVMPTFLVLLLLGWPVAVFMAWAFELTPDGIERARIEAADPTMSPRAATVGFLLVCALAAVTGVAVWMNRSTDARDGAAHDTSGTAAAVDDAPSPGSVAVLPFADLSREGDQGWFTDGLTEEILNSLARIPELQVPARTSSFQFKNQDRDIREIAELLDVAHVVEGSVRRIGDDLRVTAQLVRASDGFHLWSDTYAGTTGDLFEVQRDVAENIASALDVLLDEEARDAMFRSGTRDVRAFEAYLRGQELATAAHTSASMAEFAEGLLEANERFERAMELDPGYAEPAIAHSDLFAHVLMDGIASPYSPEEARAALLDDLDYATTNAANATTRLVASINREFFSPTWHRMSTLADELGRSPGFERISNGNWLELILRVVDLDLASRLAEATAERDRLDPVTWNELATVRLAQGDAAAARAVLEQGRKLAGSHPYYRFTEQAIALYEGDVAALEGLWIGGTDERAARAWETGLAGDRNAVARLIREAEEAEGRPKADPLILYRALGDSASLADLAGRVDALPAGPAILLRLVATTGNQLPFDLADTPRFAARLREAGVDPDVFHPVRPLLAVR